MVPAAAFLRRLLPRWSTRPKSTTTTRTRSNNDVRLPLFNHFDSRGGSCLVIADREQDAVESYEKKMFGYLDAFPDDPNMYTDLIYMIKDEELSEQGELHLAPGLKLEDLIHENGTDLMQMEPPILLFKQEGKLILAPWTDPIEDTWDLGRDDISLEAFGEAEHVPTGEDAYGLILLRA